MNRELDFRLDFRAHIPETRQSRSIWSLLAERINTGYVRLKNMYWLKDNLYHYIFVSVSSVVRMELFYLEMFAKYIAVRRH